MTATMKIAVAGATGRVGHHLVEVLEARGHEVVAIARSTGVDVITGQGLAEALEGVDCIVDTATSPSPDQQEAGLLHHGVAQPARCRPREGAPHGGGLDHRRRPVHIRLQRPSSRTNRLRWPDRSP